MGSRVPSWYSAPTILVDSVIQHSKFRNEDLHVKHNKRYDENADPGPGT